MSFLAVVIPTFKRAHLLQKLLEDLKLQSAQPDLIVVIDGGPSTGEVCRMLNEKAGIWKARIRYVPSNHANLAYQRYLGWRVASAEKSEVLVFLDDDLRIMDHFALELLIAPLLLSNAKVVGCTGEICFGDLSEIGEGQQSVRDRHDFSKKPQSAWVKWFGASRGLSPGALTASGHRCLPDRSLGQHAPVEWLRGGVMAYRMSALSEDCFSPDLFALSEIGCGHGEDTLLSRRVASRGNLLMIFDALFEHPNADAPKAYATKAFRMAWGSAYSRRLLNDNYRWPAPPTLGDRLALWKSYLGNAMLGWARVLRQPRRHRFAYAWGYTMGAIYGIFRVPTSSRLTPQIDWRKQAEAVLSALPN